ncbi:MAG: hypothetical protein DMD38_15810, partial [Gemmatimonadetes bacterium]
LSDVSVYDLPLDIVVDTFLFLRTIHSPATRERKAQQSLGIIVVREIVSRVSAAATKMNPANDVLGVSMRGDLEADVPTVADNSCIALHKASERHGSIYARDDGANGSDLRTAHPARAIASLAP